MYNGIIVPITLSIATPYTTCVSIEYVNRCAKNISNGKAMVATLMTSEFLK